jgi:hypothetical protein
LHSPSTEGFNPLRSTFHKRQESVGVGSIDDRQCEIVVDDINDLIEAHTEFSHVDYPAEIKYLTGIDLYNHEQTSQLVCSFLGMWSKRIK